MSGTIEIEMATTSIDDLLDPAFLSGLTTLAIDELRTRRSQATEVEVGLSYVRRLVQGRLDIVMTEAKRRESGGSEGDIADLVSRLPEILSDRVRGPGNGRLPTLMAPAEMASPEIARLDAIVDAEQLGSLPRVDDTDLRAMVDALAAFEREVSAGRRALFDVIDQLQGELVRRYKTGEAIVDTLLS